MALIFASCEPLPCLDNKDAVLRLSFVRDSSGIVLPALYDVDSIFQTINGQRKKTQSGSARISNLLISFPVNSDSIQYQSFDSLGNDRFSFLYQISPQFVSEECGYRAKFTLRKVNFDLGNRIKEIRVLHQTVDTITKTHVQVVLFD